ncbi:MAG: class I SAM-dependent methyltransferase [Pontiellaceae bacterium]|nr:class I SAM-dependent methyltransferase [Pontiellaceae bacterium]
MVSEMNISSNSTYWDLGGEKEPLMHRIHAYPAKFPAFITQKAVAHARGMGVDVKRIADVFCGCGTTALEAKRLNTDFWGCDINPVATLIARVKRNDYQKKRLEHYLSDILRSYARRHRLRHSHYLKDDRLNYWFNEDTILELSRVKAAIDTVPEGKYRDFFLCAFSNILKPTSRWLTKSIKPQVDPEKKPVDVMPTFKGQVALMIKALNEISEQPEKKARKEAGSIIVTGNILEMDFVEPMVDLIVTSPPYVTSYEYADLHQLSSLWLGYTDDYRKLRTGTMGSLYHDSDFTRDIKKLNSTGYGIVFQLYDVDRRKARASAKYFVDLHQTVRQCVKLLNPGGMLLFVIGNTEYKGVKIDNAGYLLSCLVEEGFCEIESTKRAISSKILTPYRDARGKFTTDTTSRKVYAEEFVVTGRMI